MAPTNRSPCVRNNLQRIILKRWWCDFSVMWSEWWPVKTKTPPTCQLTFLHNQPTDLYNQWLKPLRNAVYVQEKSTLSLFVSKSLYDDNKVLFFESTQKITKSPPPKSRLLTTWMQDTSLRSEIIKISLILVFRFFVAKQLEFATGHDSYEDTCSINIQSFTPRARFWEFLDTFMLIACCLVLD